VPSLIQSAHNTGTGTTVTVTLGAAAGLGNCLVVPIAGLAAAAPSVSSVKIGGVADNFALAKKIGVASFSDLDCEIWTDQNIGTSSTSVVGTFSASQTDNYAFVEEWSGIASSAAVDKTNAGTTTNATFSSGSSGVLTNANEVVVGASVAASATGTTSETGPGAPWNNLAQIQLGTGTLIMGSQIVTATTAQTYSGTVSGGNGVFASAAVIITLLEAAGTSTPSPFTPPQRAPRGAPGAGRGRSASSRGAPVSPTPSPFTPPRRAPRGAPGAGRGHSLSGLSSRGAPVSPTPSPFTPPRRAPRGAPGARRGRALSGTSSPGAPVFVRKTLLISLASAAGTDDYGTPYPEGILATAGVIQGPTFIGSNFEFNTQGQFWYSGAPAAGNLVMSNTNIVGGGTDRFGNHFVFGVGLYDNAGGFFTQLGEGFTSYGTGSLAAGWTANSTVENDGSGNLILGANGAVEIQAPGGLIVNGTSVTVP